MYDLSGKRLLVVSAVPHRAESFREVLQRAGMDVTVVLTPQEALLAFSQLPQDILLIDGRFGEPFPDAFPRTRLQHQGRPPKHVLLIDPPRGPALQHWMRVLDGHGLGPKILTESNPYQVIEALLRALEGTDTPPLVQASGSLHPAGMPPQPEALHFVLGLWSRRRSGRLEMPLMGLSARMVLGEPASPADLPVIVQAMYVGGATFARDEGVSALQVDEVLGEHLWQAGQRLASPEYVMGRMSHLLVERSAGRRAEDLPTPQALKDLLARRRGRSSVLGLCAQSSVAPSTIAAPLSALIKMGMFSLRPSPTAAPADEPPSLIPSEEPTPVPERVEHRTARPSQVGTTFSTERFSAPREAEPPPRAPAPPSPPPRVTPPRFSEAARPPSPVSPLSPPDPAQGASHVVQAPVGRGRPRRSFAEATRSVARARPSTPEAEAAQLKRLQREWELIELADDWTTLGIPKDSSSALISKAVDRLERRYGALVKPEQPNAEIRELASRILERVRSAGAAIQSGDQRKPGEGEPEAAFRQGVRALERGDFPRAARWLQSARQSDPRSAVYNGYLGWAVYNDPTLDRTQRRKKGLELLQLAEVTAEPLPELQYFLAMVEKAEGENDRARVRLRRLLRMKPGYTAAQRALDSLPAEELE
ncbi:MAG: hypothetical protein H6741_27310 [Alphaproteobacteria bacterium]|nr:hypothetical protein [Alphaproteobacteria bacterium]MCB9796422.1 hypothetical protein [Alphaproteobacteria bacterium]